MMERVLYINDVHATDKPVQYVCFGLGSCIGLFITDRLSGLSGGAHIPFPSSSEGSLHGAEELIEALLCQMQGMGSSLDCLRAKLTGGARMYGLPSTVGTMNIDEVLRQLIQRKIYVAAKDTGGTVSRTARFNSVTGDLRITTSEMKEYTI